MALFFKMISFFSASVAPEAAPQISFDPAKFVEMLQYMGKGMLVIFVIIGVIILTTLLINRIFSAKK